MFDNFISLGWFCGTAASMSKHGIRSCSGPFDWYFSDFKGVLACMNNDFADFLNKKNLKMLDGRPGEVVDTKYGFHYNHEVRTCFEEDFDFIYDKYTRRIEKFRKMVKRKTCFIRAVRSNEELKYIQDNSPYIQEVIKKNNSENEIIYVVSNKEIACGNLGFPFFAIDSIYDGASRKGLRSLFDSNIELQQFCIQNFDEDFRYRNLYYDLQKENQILGSKAAKYELMMCIEELNLSHQILPREVIIYGAGIVGKYLCNKIKGMCEVLYFIDKYSTENTYENIPIINIKDFVEQGCEGIPVIVTTYNYDAVRLLLEETGVSDIQSINDFFHE